MDKELSSEEICKLVLDRLFEELYKYSPLMNKIKVEQILVTLNDEEFDRFMKSMIEEAKSIYTLKITAIDGVERLYNSLVLLDKSKELWIPRNN